MNIDNIRKRQAEILAELEELDAQDSMTDEEGEKFDKLSEEFDSLSKDEEVEIAKEEKRTVRKESISGMKDYLTQPIKQPIKPEINKGNSEFASFGELLKIIRFSPFDPRLEKRELEVSTDESGGFLVPDEFIDLIRMVDPAAQIIRPRATVIPAGDRPDQKILMPTLDQTAVDGTAMYGGVVVTWIEEGVTKPETDMAFKEVTLEPKEVAGHIIVSDRLIRNAPAIETLVGKKFRQAINGAEEDAFLSNALATRPLGFIPHAATLAVNRQTANTIVYQDIVNMFAGKHAGGAFIWIASVSTLATLMRMKDFESAESDAPNLVWQPDIRVGIPGTLLGFPVLLSDQTPALGTKGDLSLVDLSYYLIKDGYGIAIAASEHVHFTKNKTVIKAFWTVDGKPWLTSPITVRDGTTQVSPFVVLDVPAVGS